MPKIPLTKNKRKWAKNRKVTLRGSRLNYNAAQQARYERALRKLVRQMTSETKSEVVELFRSDTAQEYSQQQKQAATLDASITSKAKKLMNALTARFQGLFDKKAPELAKSMLDGAKQVSKSNLHSSLQELSGGLSLATGVIPKGMDDIAAAIIAENVSLIKNIPEKYFTNITGAVMRSIAGNTGIGGIIEVLQKEAGITERRAKNIALDQTRKAYNSINKVRMQATGVKQFEWVHSGGGAYPRKSHMAMSGKIFSFDDLPVINQEQVDAGYESPVRGIPGQAINCGCTMIPVIDLEDVEL